jgi:hypothetical protein
MAPPIYLADRVIRDRIEFRIFYANTAGPPRAFGQPGDLFIQLSTNSLYYKITPTKPLHLANADPRSWVHIPGESTTDIRHPCRHFHLVASTNGPIWMGYMYSSAVSYTESIRAFVDSKRDYNCKPMQIYFFFKKNIILKSNTKRMDIATAIQAPQIT